MTEKWETVGKYKRKPPTRHEPAVRTIMRNHRAALQQLDGRRRALYMRIKRLYERYKDHPLLVDDPIELRKARLLAYKQKRRR